jgi:hypothetical protein
MRKKKKNECGPLEESLIFNPSYFLGSLDVRSAGERWKLLKTVTKGSRHLG